MTRAASSYSARSVGGRGQTRGVVVVGEKWAHVVRTPPDRRVVGAGPVGSGHGSYQLVSYGGVASVGAPLWPMLSGGSQGARSATSRHFLAWQCGRPFCRARPPCDSVLLDTPRRRDVAATTEHGPWGGTNTGHHRSTLTDMTHAHYQPALHPPPSDLGEF